MTQAQVTDIVSECNGAGSGPYTIFNVSNVSSGQIYDRITEANAFLQQSVGLGGATPVNAWQTECIKRFEVAYASAHLASNLIGVIITDGFNVTTGGIAIQRQTAQQQAYVRFITDHLNNAMEWRKMLNPWFYPGSPTYPQGSDEYGNPVGYWNTSPARY